MASAKFSLVLLLACVLSFRGVLADIICENLSTNVCAFAVSSSGKRYVLENVIMDGKVEYQCKTSEVVVGGGTAEYLESDKCVEACGVDRKCVGMSSDALLEPSFAAKLCSPACYERCPNIVDLYFNLAAGEGVYLPDMCGKERGSLRRDMAEVLGGNAAAPVSSRRAMVELLSSGAAAAPVASRRAMVELLSSGVAAAPDADAPMQHRSMAEVLSDDFVVDAPAVGYLTQYSSYRITTVDVGHSDADLSRKGNVRDVYKTLP